MRRTGIVAAVVAVCLLGFGLAWQRDIPQLVWQHYGPEPASLKATTHGIKDANLERSTIDGQPVAVAIPPKPNGTLVVWFHGNGGTVDEVFTGSQQVGTRDRLLDAGYAIASSDAFLKAWGNEESTANYAKTIAWATAEAGTRKTAFIGQSMGGLSSLELADEARNVIAWVGLSPVCNLDAVAPTFPEGPSAWGREAWESVPSMSPVEGDFDGLPMLFFASDRDSVVPRATNTDECADEYRANGADVEVIDIFGSHGNQSMFQPDRLLQFLAAAAA